MSHRSDISLGDLLDAFRELEPDEATKLAIASLLRLRPFDSLEEARDGETAHPEGLDDLMSVEDAREEAGRRVPGARTAGSTGRDDQLGDEQPPEPVVPPQPDEVAEEISPEEASAPVIPSHLKKIGDDKGGVPPLREGASLLPKAAGQGDARPHTFEPLLFPIWTRAILSGALSSRSDDGPLNITKVVEEVASGKASTRLPRYPRPTLARGVQVLVDRSETMLLFLEDQKWLEGEIQKVVGPGRAQILYFEVCPARKAGAGRGSKRNWKSYLENHLPSSGTVLLLLTDWAWASPFRRPRPRARRNGSTSPSACASTVALSSLSCLTRRSAAPPPCTVS